MKRPFPVAHFLERIDQMVLLGFFHRRVVQLNQVNVFGLHPCQAFVQSAKEVVCCPHVGCVVGVLVPPGDREPHLVAR